MYFRQVLQNQLAKCQFVWCRFLSGSSFIGADPRGANLKGANLNGAILYEALIDPDILEQGVSYDEKTIWPKEMFDSVVHVRSGQILSFAGANNDYKRTCRYHSGERNVIRHLVFKEEPCPCRRIETDY